MIVMENVSKQYRTGIKALQNFSLKLEHGVLGLLGPNGAGKTTLLQIIATLLKPTTGTITFDDVDILSDPDYLRQRLGYLPQDFGVYDNLTAIEFLTYFAALKGVSSKSRIQEMLEMVNLHSAGKRRVGEFSGGMKQRLGIAQALVNDPSLLIVDEPTAGLDPEERVRFRNILSDIGEGRTVILSTHIVPDVESIATRIAILRQGKLVAYDTPESLIAEAQGSVWEARLGSEDFERYRAILRFSQVSRKGDGVYVRLVSPQCPIPEASSAEAGLEDAFLLRMNSESETVTATA